MIQYELPAAQKTMVDWLNFIHKVCGLYLLDHPIYIGRPRKGVYINDPNICIGSTNVVSVKKVYKYLVAFIKMTPLSAFSSQYQNMTNKHWNH